MQDVRIALRLLRKAPGFTAAAVLSLALGIGANTAVFSLVDAFLLQALPVRNPGELVLLVTTEGARGQMSRGGENNGYRDPSGRFVSTSFSLLAFDRMRESFSGVELFAFAPFSKVNVMVEGVPEASATAQLVSGNYQAVLGVPPAIGRTLTLADDRPDARPVAVISYRFWQRRFGGAPDVVGRTMQINRVPAEIIGVTARGFEGVSQIGESPDVSVALAHYLLFQPDRSGRSKPGYWWLRIMGRLAPGTSAVRVQASLESVFQTTAREGWLAGRTAANATDVMPDDPVLTVEPGAQGENDTRRQIRRPLRILMGLVSLVLAAACANVANLVLARGTGRQREMAVRLALGARRSRIVRQLLVEALLISIAGTALGLAITSTTSEALIALRPFGPAIIVDVSIDARVLGFTLAAALVTTVLFGLAPALRTSRVDLSTHFHSGLRTLGSGGRSPLARTLTVVQIALSVLLLVSTGLFAHTLANLKAIDPGFDTRGLVLFHLDATSAGYTLEQAAAMQKRVLERLQRLPGVSSATFSSVALLSGVRQNNRVSVSGHVPASGVSPVVNTNGLAPGFFAAMRLPIVLGRAFTDGDDMRASPVAVVSEGFVRDFFGGQNPIGQQIIVGRTADRATVIGVAADAKYTALRGGMPPVIYFPAFQHLDGDATFALRLTSPRQTGVVFAAIHAAVRDVDPALPVLNLRTQEEQLDRLHAPELLFARLSGMFGLLVTILACVGLYGLLSQFAARRSGEFGLRLAIGAQPAQLQILMLRDSGRLVAIGLAAGIVGAWLATRLIASMLYGLAAIDPVAYGSAAIVLVAAALAASWIPVRRVSGIDPLTALRAE